MCNKLRGYQAFQSGAMILHQYQYCICKNERILMYKKHQLIALPDAMSGPSRKNRIKANLVTTFNLSHLIMRVLLKVLLFKNKITKLNMFKRYIFRKLHIPFLPNLYFQCMFGRVVKMF